MCHTQLHVGTREVGIAPVTVHGVTCITISWTHEIIHVVVLQTRDLRVNHNFYSCLENRAVLCLIFLESHIWSCIIM